MLKSEFASSRTLHADDHTGDKPVSLIKPAKNEMQIQLTSRLAVGMLIGKKHLRCMDRLPLASEMALDSGSQFKAGLFPEAARCKRR
jgi:hypothetical protein